MRKQWGVLQPSEPFRRLGRCELQLRSNTAQGICCPEVDKAMRYGAWGRQTAGSSPYPVDRLFLQGVSPSIRGPCLYPSRKLLLTRLPGPFLVDLDS